MLKTIQKNLTALMMSALLVIGAPVAASAITPEEAMTRLAADTTEIDKFVGVLDQASVNEDFSPVSGAAKALATHMDESSKKYAEAAKSETEQAKKDAYQGLSSATSTMAQHAAALVSLAEGEDIDAYNATIDKLNGGIDQYNSALNAFNSAHGYVGSDYETFLIVSLIVSTLISGALLTVWLRGRKQKAAEKVRREHQLGLFKSSLWPFAGSLISLVWYELTPPGGTVTVLWGAILFGYILFAIALYKYFTTVRPGLKKGTAKAQA